MTKTRLEEIICDRLLTARLNYMDCEGFADDEPLLNFSLGQMLAYKEVLRILRSLDVED